jgi:hypothetical protein
MLALRLVLALALILGITQITLKAVIPEHMVKNHSETVLEKRVLVHFNTATIRITDNFIERVRESNAAIAV